MSSLQTRTYADAVIYPTRRMDDHPGKLLMGVFDKDGAYIEGTAIERTRGETGAAVDPGLYGDPATSDVPEVIFAGVIYNHFGHFLVESLARAWYFAEHPDATIVFAGGSDPAASPTDPRGYTALTGWQEQILDALGVTNPRLVVKYPTQFNTVHIPDPGYRYADHFEAAHAEYLARCDVPAQQPGRKLWLSRSRTGGAVKDVSAVSLERRLVAAGWQVEYPEQLSVREQLNAMGAAEVVAGEEGSAFHLMILIPNLRDKRFVMFRRSGPEHPNMHTIGDARAVNQTFHSLTKEKILAAAGREVTKLNPNAGEALDILGVPVLPLPEASPSGANERFISSVVEIAGFERVLVAGDGDPHIAREIHSASVTAVSDSHVGDPRAYEAEGIKVYDLALPEYVEHFHGDATPFQCVVVVGTSWRDIVRWQAEARSAADPSAMWILCGRGTEARKAALVLLQENSGLQMTGEPCGDLVVLRGATVAPLEPERVDAMNIDEVTHALTAFSARRS